MPFSRQLVAKRLREGVQVERAGDGARGMIGLFARRAEQHMQRVADDLGDGALVGENDVRHAGEIVVEQLAEHARLDRFDERGEAGDVGEKSGDLAALPGEADPVRIAREPLREVGREVARQRSMRPLCRRLPAPRLAQDLEVSKRLGDRRLEVGEVDRLGQEIEGAAVHRRADVGHVAIGGDDDGRKLLLGLLQLLQQRQAVHARHVDVAHHHVDVGVRFDERERLEPVMREQEAHGAVADLAAEFLHDERFEVRLVVDDEDARGHAAIPSRASISPRSAAKSIGLVSSASAPLSSALRLVSASP